MSIPVSISMYKALVYLFLVHDQDQSTFLIVALISEKIVSFTVRNGHSSGISFITDAHRRLLTPTVGALLCRDGSSPYNHLGIPPISDLYPMALKLPKGRYSRLALMS